MRPVFICHSSDDSASAGAVCRYLEERGITCWIAPRDVTAGAEYAGEIVAAIERARVLVVMLSHASLGSPQVSRELERATSDGTPLLPVRLDDTPLPRTFEYYVGQHHWVDAAEGVEGQLPAIESALRGLGHGAGEQPQRPATERQRATETRRRAPPWLPWAVAVAAVIGALAWGLWRGGASARATVNVTCVPDANVRIGDRGFGETPQALELEPGTYEVVFQREDFRSRPIRVEARAGEPQTVTGALILPDTARRAAFSVLAEALDLEAMDLQTPQSHRGSRTVTTLVWPLGTLRKSALRTYRIDVDWSIEDGARLEFRLGRKVLHAEPFAPECMFTVAPIPKAVLDAALPGNTLTWGLRWPRDPGNNFRISGKFKVVSGEAVDEALKRLRSTAAYNAQGLATRAALATQVLYGQRHYTEALTLAFGVARLAPGFDPVWQQLALLSKRLKQSSSKWATASIKCAKHVGKPPEWARDGAPPPLYLAGGLDLEGAGAADR